MKWILLGMLFFAVAFFSIEDPTTETNETPQIQQLTPIGQKAQHYYATTPRPPTVDGNCLPVAVKLQKELVSSGHMAVIVLVKDPNETVGHALVMYNSIPGQGFDTLIDNGFMTDFTPISRDRLFDGSLGTYHGICDEVYADIGKCKIGDVF